MKRFLQFFIVFLSILFITSLVNAATPEKKKVRPYTGPYIIDTEVLKQHNKLYDRYKPDPPEVYQVQVDTDWPFCPRYPDTRPCWTWGKADYLKNLLRK